MTTTHSDAAWQRRCDLLASDLHTLVFHDSDPDGWGAAWSIRDVLPNATFVKLRHGSLDFALISRIKAKELAHIVPADTNLIVTDLSFDREQTLMLADYYASVTVIDHHASAEKTIGDLDYVFIDTSRSAAMMAWEFFHDTPATPMIKYIQDYDIWAKKLDFTEEVNLVIQSDVLDFDRLDLLDFRLCNVPRSSSFKEIIREGEAIRRFRDNQVRIIAGRSHKAVFIDYKDLSDMPIGSVFACANTPLLESEVGNEINSGVAFSVCWQQLPSGDYKYSLRSRHLLEPQAVDVSLIAKHFGGGGHTRAAAFRSKVKVHELTK